MDSTVTESVSDGSGSSDSEGEHLSHTNALITSKVTGKRFTTKQRAVLSAYYKTGMKGVGELYSSRIAQAAEEAGLQTDQVKVKPRPSR